MGQVAQKVKNAKKVADSSTQLAMGYDDFVIPYDKKYFTTDLITYIGNKRSLLPFIEDTLQYVKDKLGKHRIDSLDLFAGSGAVSRLLKEHSSSLVSNDFEYYTKIINQCYLSNMSEWQKELYEEERIKLLGRIERYWKRGFIAEMYAPENDKRIKSGERVFYTRRNAEYIDTARQHIEKIPEEIRHFFLGPLLVRASIHSNTGGVFKGFYKNYKGIGCFGGNGKNALKRILGEVEIPRPIFSQNECDVSVTNLDVAEFSDKTKREYDLAYLDPPYNQHPYGSNYFMLNLIAKYKKPKSISKVSGIPDDWNRSPFNKPNEVHEAFFSCIRKLKAKFIMISYNNEGFLKKEDFVSELKKHGKLTCFESNYNTYRGCRNLSGRSNYVIEYLFLLEKHHV